MGEANRKMEAEQGEESAVVIIERIKEMLAVPAGVPLLSYVEKEITRNKDLIVAAKLNRDRKIEILVAPTAEDMIAAAIFKIQRMAYNVCNSMEMQRKMKENRIVMPDVPGNDGGIIH